MKLRLSAQMLGAIVSLALLAAIALIANRDAASTVDSYASTDYASGGVRAWAVLLEREGLATTRFVRRSIELEASIDTLISIAPLPFARGSLPRTAAEYRDLAAWVKRGGRLVYVGRTNDPAEVAELQLPTWLPDVGARGDLRGPLEPTVVTLQRAGDNRMLALGHQRSEIGDGNGAIVVQYPLGRGEVVAVSDPYAFTNGQLAHAGNARLAYVIARPTHGGGSVAFDDGVHGALRDRPWYRALSAPEILGLSIAALAIVLGVIGGALRGGPAVSLRVKREPTSAEFLDALAALYERTHAREAVREILSRDALAASARSVGASDRISIAELRAKMRDRRGAAALDALVANDARALHSDHDVLTSAQLAYDLRKEVTHGGHGDGSSAAFRGGSGARRRR